MKEKDNEEEMKDDEEEVIDSNENEFIFQITKIKNDIVFCDMLCEKDNEVFKSKFRKELFILNDIKNIKINNLFKFRDCNKFDYPKIQEIISNYSLGKFYV